MSVGSLETNVDPAPEHGQLDSDFAVADNKLTVQNNSSVGNSQQLTAAVPCDFVAKMRSCVRTSPTKLDDFLWKTEVHEPNRHILKIAHRSNVWNWMDLMDWFGKTEWCGSDNSEW